MRKKKKKRMAISINVHFRMKNFLPQIIKFSFCSMIHELNLCSTELKKNKITRIRRRFSVKGKILGHRKLRYVYNGGKKRRYRLSRENDQNKIITSSRNLLTISPFLPMMLPTSCKQKKSISLVKISLLNSQVKFS